MSVPPPLSPEQEAEAQRLASQIHDQAHSDILAIARLLVSKPEAAIFGQTEFQVRDLIHHVGAKAFEIHLREKKTATRDPASSASIASKRRTSKVTGRRSR